MGARGPLPKAAFAQPMKPGRGVGEPPTYITDDAKMHYMALASLLKDRLEPEDEATLAHCSQAMAEIALANVSLQRDDYVTSGPQGPVMNPWVRVRDLAHKRFDSAAAKLGLSPADRIKIKASLAEITPDVGSPDFDSSESA